ncbi:MAG: adenosine kinase [Gammaproteobacteria bacterium]|nr:MAG: adenosine kinase [Gammaproteobacteria bacterium]
MKRHDVYGLGNALVDLEIDIPHEKLTELGVDKSHMTLIEEDRHHELLDALTEFEAQPCGGGSAANTMTAIAQLGSRAFYSCKVADDATGQFFVDDMKHNGVTSNLERHNLPPGITGKCIVLITPDAERSMSTFLGITREFSVAELDEDALRHSARVYIEGYLVPEPHARAAAVHARRIAEEAGVLTSLTLSDLNMVSFFRDGLLEIIGDGLDLIFANQEEALGMFDTTSLEDAMAGMKGIARQWVITRGEHGAVVFDGNNLTDIPARRVTPIDLNGAGDIYAGSFLYGLSVGMPFTRCAELAGQVATTLVQRHGARLPKHDMQALLKSFG